DLEPAPPERPAVGRRGEAGDAEGIPRPRREEGRVQAHRELRDDRPATKGEVVGQPVRGHRRDGERGRIREDWADAEELGGGGGVCGDSSGAPALPGKLTLPPIRPNSPMPSVSGESSSRRNASATAGPAPTPLSLRETPKRFVGGKAPWTEPAGRIVSRWVLG